MNIRIFCDKDKDDILNIYNQAVRLRNSTCDISEQNIVSKSNWFKEHQNSKYPIYVAENENMILGWCSLSPYRSGRMALDTTAEISYYVHEDYRQMGIASKLIEHAISKCKENNIKNLFAILIDSNIPSISILKRFGFEKWGFMPKVVEIDDKKHNHLYYGKNL